MAIGNEQTGDELGLKPRARILATAVSGADPTIMLTGPAPACAQGAGQGRPERRGPRPDRDQRGVRRRRAAVRQGHGPRHGQGQRQRRRDRDGPPARRDRRMILGTLIDELERQAEALRPGDAVRRRRHGHRDRRGARLMSDPTIRYERGDDGVVVLTLDDPNQSANTMNAAYKASMAATVDRLEAEKDEIAGVVITSRQEDVLRRRRPRRPAPRDARRTRPQVAAEIRGAQGAAAPPGDARQAGRRGASTARRWAAAWRSRWPPTTGSPSTTRRSCSASRRSSSGCCPAAAACPARCACSASPTRCCSCCSRASGTAPPPRWSSASSTRSSPRATTSSRRPRSGSRPTPRPSSRGTSRATRSPAARRRPRARRQPARVPRQPAQADQGRELPGAAPHHGRGGRGRAGRLRHRDRDRGPLLRRPGHRARSRRT